MPFVEGFVDRGLVAGDHILASKYCKDLFGRVYIKMSVQSDPLENTITADASIVAMIPEGFRPRETIIATAYGWPNNSVGGIATISVRANGQVLVFGVSPYAYAHGQITYLAK
ncbi:hypothetical protein D7X25_32070 [bacterium 1XD42-8]|nr:hypothetical protein D7X25_32070 [bacterium 1XD42-8]